MKLFLKYTVAEEYRGLTVEVYLKHILQHSGRKVQKLTRQKGILVNGKTVYLQRKLIPGDILSILVPEDTSYGVKPEPGPVEILFEDDYIVILNKPPYLLVHPVGQTSQGTLANYLAYYYQQSRKVCTIRPLHRLDRETSGCVVFAKDARTQTLLEKCLHNGTLKRTYLAIVQGIVIPAAGTIDAQIGPHPTLPNRRSIGNNGDPAITHYKTVQTWGNTSLLELTLETGRTHQIRLHLKYIGHEIVGDKMYGSRSQLIARQALHAVSVSLIHPKDNRRITVHAPIPPDLDQVLHNLNLDIKKGL